MLLKKCVISRPDPKVNSYIVLNIIGHVDGSFDKIFDKYILKSNNI